MAVSSINSATFVTTASIMLQEINLFADERSCVTLFALSRTRKNIKNALNESRTLH